MKKKFFAVALATTMALSTVMTASAETVDASAGFATAKSTNQAVGANFDVTYTTHVNAYGGGTNAYENVIFEFTSEGVDGKTNAQSNYLTVVCNGGAWFWNGAEAASQWTASDGTIENGKLTCTNTCTDTDMSVLKDADLTINAKKDGAKLTISGTVGGSEIWTFSVEGNDGFASASGYVHLTGEKTKLTNVEFKDNSASDDTKATAAAPADDTKATTAAPAGDTKATTKAAASVKTGDAAPVAALAAVAVVACAAVVVSRKKVTE